MLTTCSSFYFVYFCMVFVVAYLHIVMINKSIHVHLHIQMDSNDDINLHIHERLYNFVCKHICALIWQSSISSSPSLLFYHSVDHVMFTLYPLCTISIQIITIPHLTSSLYVSITLQEGHHYWQITLFSCIYQGSVPVPILTKMKC